MTPNTSIAAYQNFINAVDQLDKNKREVIVWSNSATELDLTVEGKAPKARLYIDEDDGCCSIILFDQSHQYDTELQVSGDVPGDYIDLAKRVIEYLHNPKDMF